MSRYLQRCPIAPAVSTSCKCFDLADVLRRAHQLEKDPFAMTACREAPTLNDRHLVRHARVLRVVSDAIDSALRDDLSRFELLVHKAAPVVRTCFCGRGPAPQCSAATGAGFRRPHLIDPIGDLWMSGGTAFATTKLSRTA